MDPSNPDSLQKNIMAWFGDLDFSPIFDGAFNSLKRFARKAFPKKKDKYKKCGEKTDDAQPGDELKTIADSHPADATLAAMDSDTTTTSNLAATSTNSDTASSSADGKAGSSATCSPPLLPKTRPQTEPGPSTTSSPVIAPERRRADAKSGAAAASSHALAPKSRAGTKVPAFKLCEITPEPPIRPCAESFPDAEKEGTVQKKRLYVAAKREEMISSKRKKFTATVLSKHDIKHLSPKEEYISVAFTPLSLALSFLILLLYLIASPGTFPEPADLPVQLSVISKNEPSSRLIVVNIVRSCLSPYESRSFAEIKKLDEPGSRASWHPTQPSNEAPWDDYTFPLLFSSDVCSPDDSRLDAAGGCSVRCPPTRPSNLSCHAP